jgi:hypothetical protein
MTLTIPPLRRTKAGLVPSLVNPAWTAGQEAPVEGWYAQLEADGLTLNVSKLDGETGWTIDDAFTAAGYPIHANGYGARYLRTRELRAEYGQTLDRVLTAYATIGTTPTWSR